MTEANILENSHIPTVEIELDVKITEGEIKQFQEELDALMGNPVENKLGIYMREGKISTRKEFVKNLTEILEYRKLNQ